MAFYQYSPRPWEEVLPHASKEARDLVGKFVTYQSSDRMNAAEVGPFSPSRTISSMILRC